MNTPAPALRLIKSRAPKWTPDDVLDRVAAEHGITRRVFVGKGKASRRHRVADARRDAALRLRSLGLGVREIGEVLERDHSTICYLLGRSKRGRERWEGERDGK